MSAVLNSGGKLCKALCQAVMSLHIGTSPEMGTSLSLRLEVGVGVVDADDDGATDWADTDGAAAADAPANDDCADCAADGAAEGAADGVTDGDAGTSFGVSTCALSWPRDEISI